MNDMELITLTPERIQLAINGAARLRAESDEGHDDDLPPEERKNRINIAEYLDVDGEWKPTALKFGDQVMVGLVDPMFVLGPGRGREWVAVGRDDLPTLGPAAMFVHWRSIVDRAPIDTNELPMPIGPATEEEPQQP